MTSSPSDLGGIPLGDNNESGWGLTWGLQGESAQARRLSTAGGPANPHPAHPAWPALPAARSSRQRLCRAYSAVASPGHLKQHLKWQTSKGSLIKSFRAHPATINTNNTNTQLTLEHKATVAEDLASAAQMCFEGTLSMYRLFDALIKLLTWTISFVSSEWTLSGCTYSTEYTEEIK